MDLLPGINHARLLALAQRIVGHDEAEDVVQSAYLKAHQARGTFRSECRKTTWLYRITQRCALDVLRRRRRRPEERLDGREMAQIAEPLLLDARLRDARRRMAHLSPVHQETLRMMTVCDTGAEAAKALGLTLAAFKNRLHRARRALQETT